MNIREMESLLNKAIPREVEYMKGEPYGFFGLGLPNKTELSNREVKRALYCVTPTPAVVKFFKAGKYDVLISHHPYIQRGVPHFVYHTALDCCEGGLNDQWRDVLGVKNPQHFDGNLGWYGDIEPIDFFDLVKKIEVFCGGVIGQKYIEPGTGTVIRSVVICTGLGGLVNELARLSGAECYILGEATCGAHQSGFRAMIETGHTLSEWMGVLLFRKLLEPYGIKVDSAPFNVDIYGREVWRPFSPTTHYEGNF